MVRGIRRLLQRSILAFICIVLSNLRESFIPQSPVNDETKEADAQIFKFYFSLTVGSFFRKVLEVEQEFVSTGQTVIHYKSYVMEKNKYITQTS